MPEAPVFKVDAFTEDPFSGNPAAVCVMPTGLDDALYVRIAEELNISETAFLEERPDGSYDLRWFSPVREVPLCGHGTLATAHALFNDLGYKGDRVTFNTKSGKLYAARSEKGITLDFPRNDPFKVAAPEGVLEALGVENAEEVEYSDTNQKLVVCVPTWDDVASLKPNYAALLAAKNTLGWRGFIVTAPGRGSYDFVSRYFAPFMGVNEDPVTGSAHTVLAPYWAKRLGKKRMHAYQASARGGVLDVELTDERILLTGKAVTVLKGTLVY